MKRVVAFTFGLLIAVIAMTPSLDLAAGQASQAGWITLFDGKSLTSFAPVGDANWQMLEGVVQANKGTGFLVSKNSYADFQLKVEIWVDDDANSGVFIRCQDTKQITAMNAYEVNIFDKRPDPAYRTGAIVDVAKPLSMINAAGKWNTLEITAQKSHLVVTMNGVKTVDVEHAGHTRGPIALQYGAGTVKFRNVQIRTL